MSNIRILSRLNSPLVIYIISILPGQLSAATEILQPEIHSEAKTEVLIEQIQPTAVSHEQGSSYVARLTIPRAADKESKSQCKLLENGKPLPFPHALHSRIREQGAGHYSHWTPGALYFSTSDSSDPRTNGRKYELVSTEVYRQKTSSFILTDSNSEISISGIIPQEPQPLKMIWQNLDANTRLTPAWKRKGAPDLSSQTAMLASILTPDMNAEEKSIAIWKFLVDWRYHYYPAEQGDEVHDPVKFLNVYGYGFCDDCATNYMVLARKAGLQSRVWGLSGHVVAETFYDGSWHMFDPDHQVFYRNQRGQIAGVEELAEQPQLITKTPTDPLGSSSELIAKLYTSTADNRVNERQPQIRETSALPVLEPLDYVEFHYTNPESVHRNYATDTPQPPVAGNGILKRMIQDLHQLKLTATNQRVWQLNWPYVILAGQINLELTSTEIPPCISVSHNQKSWTSLQGTFEKNRLHISLNDWIKKQPTAVYHCFIRLESPNQTDPAALIKQADAELRFQFAPRALAHITQGNNDFELKLATEPAGNTKGLKVSLIWKEID
ncbi:MAG: transglutaminase domain-containing protein [Planctomycetaceae bacterium]|nr:transglutaminase domain-containing protein [Planctomycetaceae bacterium]